jgi:hypothetical protein
MKQLRQYIRRILLEDRDADRQPFVMDLLNDPNYDDNFRDISDEYSDPDEKVLQGYKDRASMGRIMKKAFAGNADRSFLESLELVHWSKDLSKIIKMLKSPSNRDELSAAAYLPGEMPGISAFGKYGLVINGYITLLANDMDALQTGYSEFYKKADPERVKSSGANKGIGNVDDESIVLSREDWDPNDFLGNEALVDNWEATGVIVPDEDYDDMVEVFDELYDKTGKEYNLYKASFGL